MIVTFPNPPSPTTLAPAAAPDCEAGSMDIDPMTGKSCYPSILTMDMFRFMKIRIPPHSSPSSTNMSLRTTATTFWPCLFFSSESQFQMIKSRYHLLDGFEERIMHDFIQYSVQSDPNGVPLDDPPVAVLLGPLCPATMKQRAFYEPKSLHSLDCLSHFLKQADRIEGVRETAQQIQTILNNLGSLELTMAYQEALLTDSTFNPVELTTNMLWLMQVSGSSSAAPMLWPCLLVSNPSELHALSKKYNLFGSSPQQQFLAQKRIMLDLIGHVTNASAARDVQDDKNQRQQQQQPLQQQQHSDPIVVLLGPECAVTQNQRCFHRPGMALFDPTSFQFMQHFLMHCGTKEGVAETARTFAELYSQAKVILENNKGERNDASMASLKSVRIVHNSNNSSLMSNYRLEQ